MHIETVKINGFMSFNNCDITFNKDKNIIVGTNGTGKSNLLKLLRIALTDNNIDKLCAYVNTDCDEHEFTIELSLEDNEVILLKNLLIVIYYSSNEQHNNNTIYIDNIKNIHSADICKNITLSYTYNKGIRRYMFIDGVLLTQNISDNESIIDGLFESILKKEFGAKNNYDKSKNFRNDVIDTMKKTDVYEKHGSMSIINILNTAFGNVKTYKDIPDRPCIYFVLLKWIIRSVHFITLDRYIGLDSLIHATSDVTTELIVRKKNSVYESLKVIDREYGIRRTLFGMISEQEEIYRKIRLDFENITGKIFKVNAVDTRYLIQDYIYQILTSDGKLYDCSYGECELINFLTEYNSNLNGTMLLIDEPCTHLSSQNKNNFRKHILEKKCDKQLIVVTHDPEMISEETSENLLLFKYVDNKSVVIDLGEVISDTHRKKLLFEHKDILFSKKCLLVEGYDDYRMVKAIMEHYKIEDVLIVIMGTCTSKLSEIFDECKINYKCLYDVDTIFWKVGGLFNYNKFKEANRITNKHLVYILSKWKGSISQSEVNNICDFIKKTSDNNIFVWNDKMEAIEGVGEMLYGGFIDVNTGKYIKDRDKTGRWRELTYQNLLDGIKAKGDTANDLQNLVSFLRA